MDFQWKRKTHWRILGIRRPGQASILRPPPPNPAGVAWFPNWGGGGGGGHSGAKLFHQFAEFVISFVQGRPGRWWPSKFSRICQRALFNFDCSKCCFWLYFDNFALLLTLNKYWIARASTVASERFWNFTRKKCYVSIFFRNFPKRLGDIGTDRSPPTPASKVGRYIPPLPQIYAPWFCQINYKRVLPACLLNTLKTRIYIDLLVRERPKRASAGKFTHFMIPRNYFTHFFRMIINTP